MDFWEAIDKRRSVRSFDQRSVPRDCLEQLLKAASSAPSSFNSQPWRFHIAQGSTRAEVGEIVARATVHLKEYMDVLPSNHYEEAVKWYSSLGDAPVVIAVSIPQAESEFDQMNKLLSVGAATENLMLAAAAEGLATCNITFAWWVRDALAQAYGVSKDRVIVSLIALGYEGGRNHPRPQRRDDIADWLE